MVDMIFEDDIYLIIQKILCIELKIGMDLTIFLMKK